MMIHDAAHFVFAAARVSHSVPTKIAEVGQSHSFSGVDRLFVVKKGSDVTIRKETDMGKVVNMSSTKKTARGPNSSDGANDTSRANFSYRLFLIVDLPTFAMIEWLRESLEAHSYGDVVRQAVRAFALRFAENETVAMSDCGPSDDSPSSDQKLKRLNIRVPGQTKDRLDFLKDRTDMSYTDIIVCGLQLLAVRAEDEEALLTTLNSKPAKGGKHASSVHTDNHCTNDYAVSKDIVAG